MAYGLFVVNANPKFDEVFLLDIAFSLPPYPQFWTADPENEPVRFPYN